MWEVRNKILLLCNLRPLQTWCRLHAHPCEHQITLNAPTTPSDCMRSAPRCECGLNVDLRASAGDCWHLLLVNRLITRIPSNVRWNVARMMNVCDVSRSVVLASRQRVSTQKYTVKSSNVRWYVAKMISVRGLWFPVICLKVHSETLRTGHYHQLYEYSRGIFLLALCNIIITSCIFVNSWRTFRSLQSTSSSRVVDCTVTVSYPTKAASSPTHRPSNLSQKYVAVTMQSHLHAGLTFHRWHVHQKSRIVRTSLANAFRTCIILYVHCEWLLSPSTNKRTYHTNIQGVTGGTDQNSGGCSLC